MAFKSLKLAVLGATAVLATAAMTAPSHAVTTGDFIGVFSGNDACPKANKRKPAIAAMGDAFCLAKFRSITGGFSAKEGSDPALDSVTLADNFMLSGSKSTSGKFSFNDQGEGFTITHIVLKAGREFSVFSLLGATVGEWMTDPHHLNKNGKARRISHISFYGKADISAVPLPAALPLFLTALLGLGFVARRRKTMAA